MDGQNPITNLGLACPYGGNFYICRDSPTQFIGCCKSDPCGERKGLCPDEHLRSASFEAKQYNQILPQACINDNRDVKWYTCAGTTPSFLGCCAVNPCAKGACPARELRAAKLSDNSKNAEPFRGGGSPLDPVSSSSTSSSSSSSSSTESSQTISSFTTSYLATTTTDTTTSVTATNTSEAGTDAPGGGHKGLGGGAIAGIIIGIFGLLVLVIGVLYFGYKYQRRWEKRAGEEIAKSRDGSAEKLTSRGSNNANNRGNNSDGSAQDYQYSPGQSLGPLRCTNSSENVVEQQIYQPPPVPHHAQVQQRPQIHRSPQSHHRLQGNQGQQGREAYNPSPNYSTPSPGPSAYNQHHLGPQASNSSLRLSPASAQSRPPHGSRDYTSTGSPSPQPATELPADTYLYPPLGNTGRQVRLNSRGTPYPEAQSRYNAPPSILPHPSHARPNMREQNQASPVVSGTPSKENHASAATDASAATVPGVDVVPGC
ncbi:hypothetical protein FALBO_5569 [Fusarium albosuccineum]|uniref:Uncharacterized protein n=1 Tax=Fusarium albosuccineum TaxID=1237068 RepID=A0A8H4LEL6_9HYPO|nr:hypothetical protein FALBO_5569 [Fusarium albosuccineum]